MGNGTWLALIIILGLGLSMFILLVRGDTKEKPPPFADLAIVYNFLNCFRKYAVFEGRSTRREFWSFYIVGAALNIAAYFLDVEKFDVESGYGPATLVLNLIITCPGLAVAARRLHDVGKSGWWQLIALTGIGIIPLIAWWVSKPVSDSYSTKTKTKSTSSQSKLADELRELKELYKDGTLSKEEFTKAKSKLLK